MAVALGLAALGCGIGDDASNVPAPASAPAMPEEPVTSAPTPQASPEPSSQRRPTPKLPPLADDPVASTAPSRDQLRMERADADALMLRLQQLPKFPIRLSELEAHLGRPVRQYFNPESHDPTFVHDRGGTGMNNGGTPLHHPSGDEDTPLLFELRSQHYARYDEERRFDDRPPFAADDPVIDLISVSDRYENGAAPPASVGMRTFDGSYAYLAEQWHIAPLHGGYLSLNVHDRSKNPGADRWVFQVTTERGLFHSPAEVEQTEQTLLDFVDAVRTGQDMPRFLADFEREHADGYDLGILQLGLTSYNVRFFDVAITEGDHAGDFLRQEGRSRALYIDSYIEGDARVALPEFFGAFGFGEYVVEPRHLPVAAPGHSDGGLLYYNDVVLEKDGWRISLTGFYPVKDGKAQSTIQIPEFLVSSLTIRHAVPASGKRKKRDR